MILSIVLYNKRYTRIQKNRHNTVENFEFPQTIRKNILKAYPHLTNEDVEWIIKELREYFHIQIAGINHSIGMPSKVVDVAWHEFILFTREYKQFCDDAFGRFLHHRPAESMDDDYSAHKGLRTAWNIACRRKHIDPKNANELPGIFAIDATLKIPEGFYYHADEIQIAGSKEKIYSASSIGCASLSNKPINNDGDNACQSAESSSSGSDGCSSSCGGD